MEIKEIKINIEKKRIGIRKVFLIPESGDMDSGNLIINEFDNNYSITAEKKLDQLDLSSAIFEFIKSEYYNEQKSFIYLGNVISFQKNDEYTDVYQKLNPVFKKCQ